jgi:hypothetical protein
MADPLVFLRDFNRYTGDGLPNAPTSAPLPIGDPTSGPYVPTKKDLRTFVSELAIAVSNESLVLTKAGNLSGISDAAVARSNIGLGNVDNTSDANKPVSTAQAVALNDKLGIDEMRRAFVGEAIRNPRQTRDWSDTLRLREWSARNRAVARIPYTGVIHYCSSTATGTNDGSNWENAFTSPSSAFTAAAPGDRIWLNSSDAAPFTDQSLDWGAGKILKQVHIECDKGPDRMTVFDNRKFGVWMDEGVGVFSLTSPFAGSPAYDFKQDDEAGTVTGVDWTRPKYRALRQRYGKTVAQVAAWYGVLKEEAIPTSTPQEGRYSYLGGKYYINPNGLPSLAQVNQNAVVPRNSNVLASAYMTECYWSGRMKLVYSPNAEIGGGYSFLIGGHATTIADVETIASGYHAIGFAGPAKDQNTMINCVSNCIGSNKGSGVANAYVFYSADVDTLDSDCWGIGCLTAHYPALDSGGKAILNYGNIYSPNLGMSHAGAGKLLGGIRWSNCAMADFGHQLNTKHVQDMTLDGSIVKGANTGFIPDINFDGEWSVVAEDCISLGASAFPTSDVDCYSCVFDRDNLGRATPLNGFSINLASGGSPKTFRLSGGFLGTGAGARGTGGGVNGSYIGPVTTAHKMKLSRVELVLEGGRFYGSPGVMSEPFLFLEGNLIKSKVKNVGFIHANTADFNLGGVSSLVDLGGNVFGEMGMIAPREGYVHTADYEGNNDEWISLVDPARRSLFNVPFYRFSGGSEKIVNGAFAGSLAGWTASGAAVSFADYNGREVALFSDAGTLYQAFDCDEGDLLHIQFEIVTRGNLPFKVSIRGDGDTDSVGGFYTLANQHTAARLYDYRLRAGPNWSAIKFQSFGHISRLASVSIKKLTAQ